MAARSGGGTGMVVTVVILGVLTLGLFITTIIFISKTNAALREKALLQQDSSVFVRDDERRRDDVGQIQAAAAQQGQSVVGYLMQSMQDTMQLVTGSKMDGVAELKNKTSGIRGAETQSLLAVIREREQALAREQQRAEAAEAARNRAQADLESTAKRVAELEAAQREALAALNAEVGVTMDEADKYREEVQRTKEEMEARIARIQEEASLRESELTGQIRELQQQNAIAQDTARKLQEQLRGKLVKRGDEYALVDARVVGMDAAAGQYYLNVGRAQKVPLGMTFEVYSDAGSIRPDEQTGEYPQGKATLEVIRVDETSSVARIIREKRGNPVVRGDVAANPLYDPNKSYKFLVYGNFDANRDGVPTPQEQAEIEALIKEWGGEVVTELKGDIDFLVLGQKPTLPPAPPSTAPVPVVQQYVELRRVVQEYDRLFEQAQSTAIPVLNENRLRTLIGGGVRR